MNLFPLARFDAIEQSHADAACLEWGHYLGPYDVICDLRPRYVVVENVPGLRRGGMGDVLGDLAAIGFDAEWESLPAAAFGAHHGRDRVWIVAHSHLPGRAWAHDAIRPGRQDEAAFVHSPVRALCFGNSIVPQIGEWIARRLIEAEAQHVGGAAKYGG